MGSESFHVSLLTRGLSASTLRLLRLEPSGKDGYEERDRRNDNLCHKISVYSGNHTVPTSGDVHICRIPILLTVFRPS